MSLSYQFGQTKTVQFFLERAFQKCKVDPSLISDWQKFSAIEHMNLIMSEWIVKGLPLFMISKAMIQIISNQNWYALPSCVEDVVEMTIRGVQPVGGGTALSSSGVAANAFNGDPRSEGCVFDETDQDQWLSYSYLTTLPQSLSLSAIGIQVGGTVPLTLSLVIEASYDGINWMVQSEEPPRVYYPNNSDIIDTSLYHIDWLVVQFPVSAPFWRVRNIKSTTTTMNIRQAYFCVTISSRMMGRLSRSEYMAMTQRQGIIGTTRSGTNGIQTSYYLDRQKTPLLYVWPTPCLTLDVDYPSYCFPYFYNNPPPNANDSVDICTLKNVLFYTYKQYFQDIKEINDPLPLVQRFYQPFIDAVASAIAKDFVPELAEALKMEAAQSFAFASRDDGERVPLSITPDLSGYMQ